MVNIQAFANTNPAPLALFPLSTQNLTFTGIATDCLLGLVSFPSGEDPEKPLFSMCGNFLDPFAFSQPRPGSDCDGKSRRVDVPTEQHN